TGSTCPVKRAGAFRRGGGGEPDRLRTWTLRDDPEDRVLRRDADEIGLRCVRAHAREELTDFPRPLLEIGAEDRWLLPVGHLLDVHGLGVPAERDSRRAADTDVAHPLGLPARRDQIALAGEAERVDGGAAPLPGLATLHREHSHALHAQAEPSDEEPYRRIEDPGGEESGLDIGIR